jgi:hypothetical protein
MFFFLEERGSIWSNLFYLNFRVLDSRMCKYHDLVIVMPVNLASVPVYPDSTESDAARVTECKTAYTPECYFV